MPAIVFESGTGFTRRYAQMLSNRTDFEVYYLRDAIKELPKSTEVFFMGWICAGKLEGYSLANRYFDIIGCAAVGAADCKIPGVSERIKQTNRIQAPLFYLRGGVNPDALTPIKRKLLEMLAKQVEKNSADSVEVRELTETFRYGGDFVREENLDEIVEWFKTL